MAADDLGTDPVGRRLSAETLGSAAYTQAVDAEQLVQITVCVECSGPFS